MSYKTKRRINFFDCDPAGIMFFGKAFELIHSAYEEMIASLGIKDYWTSRDYFVPITKAETDYTGVIKAGEEVEIEVKVSQLRKHSFELSYTCRGEKNEVLFTSKTVHVFTNREFNKIVIPPEVKNNLTKLVH